MGTAMTIFTLVLFGVFAACSIILAVTAAMAATVWILFAASVGSFVSIIFAALVFLFLIADLLGG